MENLPNCSIKIVKWFLNPNVKVIKCVVLSVCGFFKCRTFFKSNFLMIKIKRQKYLLKQNNLLCIYILGYIDEKIKCLVEKNTFDQSFIKNKFFFSQEAKYELHLKWFFLSFFLSIVNRHFKIKIINIKMETLKTEWPLCSNCLW